MEVVICESAQVASGLAAQGIVGMLQARGGYGVLGLATGNTPQLLYRELVQLYLQGKISFAQAHFFALDEYVGLIPGHPASYHTYIREHLTSKIDVPPVHVEIPHGAAADLRHEALRYEQAIRDAGGIDIQILGVGTDGHIGFNEPSSSLSSRTRVKTLSDRTIRDNTPHFPAGERVPEHVITMGIGTILDARTIYLLAFGKQKADIIAQVVEGPVSAFVPGSALQLHERVTVFLDEEAASSLRLKEYYRKVWEKKPAWQK